MLVKRRHHCESEQSQVQYLLERGKSLDGNNGFWREQDVCNFSAFKDPKSCLKKYLYLCTKVFNPAIIHTFLN